MSVATRNNPSILDTVPQTTDEVISLLDKEYTRRMKERQPFELQWRLNLCFLEGQQHVEINNISLQVDDMPEIYWYQEREVFNHIAPLYETRLARLTRMRPALKVRPQTNEPEDIRAAKVGSLILKNMYYNNEIKDRLNEMIQWLEAIGTHLTKNIWNPELGPVIGFQPHEQENMNHIEADGRQDGLYEHMEMQMDEVREGDLDIISCPAFEILPDSSYRRNVKDCRSIMHVKAYHIHDIGEIWDIDVEPESASTIRLHTTELGNSGMGYGGGDFQFANVDLTEHALVKELWERPTRMYPGGRLIISAGKKLLYYGALPFPVDEYGKVGLPFTRCTSIARNGIFWGKSFIERAIPLQRRYNSLKNKKQEFINRACIGGYDVERGSVDMDDFEANSGAPGYICEYKKGFAKPTPRMIGALPADFEKEEQNLLNEFNIFSAVSDLTKQSKAPAGVKSGVALSLALEQDDTRLALVASNIEDYLVHTGKQALRLYKENVSYDRTLREIGKNNVVELIDWSGQDIRSDDVIVEAFSAMADSPAQRRQMVFDLMGAGLLHDPDTGQINKEMRSKIFDMIELGNWEDGDSEEKLHSNKSDRENVQILEGGQPYPVAYDDHLIHISNHNKFRLTAEYETLMMQNPVIEQIFQMHVDGHLIYLMPPEHRDAMMAQQAGQTAQPPSEPVGEPAMQEPVGITGDTPQGPPPQY